MRVLLSAYACEPDKGSEPAVGWQWALAAAQRHDVTVVTRGNNRPVLEAALQNVAPELRPRFEYLDLPTKRLKRGSRGIRLYYVQWQLALSRMAQELHRREPFDVAHHLTIAADWLPCGLTSLAGEVPLVWGPVGGAMRPLPSELRPWLSRTGWAKEVVRGALTGPGRALAARRIGRRAAVAAALNSDVAASLASHGVQSVVEQNAVIPPFHGEVGRTRVGGRRTAVYVGRLESFKGLLLTVATIARLPGWRLDLYGQGPDRDRAEALADELGVTDRVRFHGHVPLALARRALASADALLFPSMRDSAPFVVAEAVAAGVPVVCLDRGGPADMIRAGGGIAVAPDSPDLPGALARALDEIEVTEPYDGRFSAERLPDLLDSWYGSARERA